MYTCQIIDSIDVRDCTPLHEVRDLGKVEFLVREMKQNGWSSTPLLALDTGATIQLLTGSHRYAAAKVAGISIPVVMVDVPLLHEHESEDTANTIAELYDALLNGDDVARVETMQELYDLGCVSQEALDLAVTEVLKEDSLC